VFAEQRNDFDDVHGLPLGSAFRLGTTDGFLGAEVESTLGLRRGLRTIRGTRLAPAKISVAAHGSLYDRRELAAVVFDLRFERGDAYLAWACIHCKKCRFQNTSPR
jgi:hypothetical protein